MTDGGTDGWTDRRTDGGVNNIPFSVGISIMMLRKLHTRVWCDQICLRPKSCPGRIGKGLELCN